MSDLDAEVRTALLKEGDDGKIPRETTFYFYGGDIAGIEGVATEEKYAVRLMKENHGLILTKIVAVDEFNFFPVAEKMEAWAQRFGSDYDGWECEVMAGN